MLPAPKTPHEIESISTGYVRCLCKWWYRIENYKGKSEEDMCLEVGLNFDRHKAASLDREV